MTGVGGGRAGTCAHCPRRRTRGAAEPPLLAWGDGGAFKRPSREEQAFLAQNCGSDGEAGPEGPVSQAGRSNPSPARPDPVLALDLHPPGTLTIPSSPKITSNTPACTDMHTHTRAYIPPTHTHERAHLHSPSHTHPYICTDTHSPTDTHAHIHPHRHT